MSPGVIYPFQRSHVRFPSLKWCCHSFEKKKEEKNQFPSAFHVSASSAFLNSYCELKSVTANPKWYVGGFCQKKSSMKKKTIINKRRAYRKGTRIWSHCGACGLLAEYYMTPYSHMCGANFCCSFFSGYPVCEPFWVQCVLFRSNEA